MGLRTHVFMLLILAATLSGAAQSQPGSVSNKGSQELSEFVKSRYHDLVGSADNYSEERYSNKSSTGKGLFGKVNLFDKAPSVPPSNTFTIGKNATPKQEGTGFPKIGDEGGRPKWVNGADTPKNCDEERNRNLRREEKLHKSIMKLREEIDQTTALQDKLSAPSSEMRLLFAALAKQSKWMKEAALPTRPHEEFTHISWIQDQKALSEVEVAIAADNLSRLNFFTKYIADWYLDPKNIDISGGVDFLDVARIGATAASVRARTISPQNWGKWDPCVRTNSGRREAAREEWLAGGGGNAGVATFMHFAAEIASPSREGGLPHGVGLMHKGGDSHFVDKGGVPTWILQAAPDEKGQRKRALEADTPAEKTLKKLAEEREDEIHRIEMSNGPKQLMDQQIEMLKKDGVSHKRRALEAPSQSTIDPQKK